MQILKPLEDILIVILGFFYGYTHSWGWAIILLTVAVKIILFPLTAKQTKAALEMQKLQPKLKKLQEKYKHNKEKLQEEMMKFYRENKVNPLGGCLPLLLQLPIFFALFRMLIDKDKMVVLGGKAVRLYDRLAESSFLWIGRLGELKIQLPIFGDRPLVAANLTEPDLILVGLMAISTYLSTKMMGTDSQQQKMMLPMTVFMVFIAMSLPAGVLIYWVTINLLTAAQQYFTLRASKSAGG